MKSKSLTNFIILLIGTIILEIVTVGALGKLSALIFVIVFLVSFFVGVFFIARFIYQETLLLSYLFKTKRERYDELVGWGNMGFRIFRYLFSNLDDENEKIFEFKKKSLFALKLSIYTAIICFVSLVAFAFCLTYFGEISL